MTPSDRTDCDGFALITVLWLVIVLGTLMLTAARPLVLASQTSSNRMGLTKARWAAHACIALLQAGEDLSRADSVALGETTWCDVRSIRPDERVNPNLGDSVGLSTLLGDPVQVAAILDWIDPDDKPRRSGAEADWYTARKRPPPRNGAIADAREIGLIRGFEEAKPDVLERVFTARGDGGVSANRAPRWALESISGVPQGLAASLLRQRVGRSFASAEQVVAVLGLDPTIPEFRTMVERLSFDEQSDVLRAVGHANVGRTVLASTLVVTVRVDRGAVRLLKVKVEE